MDHSASAVSPRALPYYVGVTGVQSPDQIAPLITSAASYRIGKGFKHSLMLGCLVSPTLERNLAPINTSKPHRHVRSVELLIETLAAANCEGCIGMLHFELGKLWPGQAGEAKPVVSLLRMLASYGLHPAVQLNGSLLPEDIHQIRNEGGVPLVLQLRKEIAERGEAEVLRYIESIASSISMILLDPSAGAGHAIDIEPAVRLHRAIDARFPGMFSFGYAGGLGGSTPDESERTTQIGRGISERLHGTDFSVDVETNVRRSSSQPGIDELDLSLCSRYFEAVMEAL